MAITNEQYLRLLNRVKKLELMANDLAVAIDKFVELSQVTQISTLIQTEIYDLREQVTALEDRVTAIENEPLT